MKYPLSKLLFHKRLFLAQCINNFVSLCLAAFWVVSAVTIGIEQDILTQEIQQIGVSAGLGFLLLLYFSGVLFRAFSILFFGVTLGFFLMNIQPANQYFTKKSWAGVFWESLHLPFVGAWFFEWILRFKGHRLWNDLDFDKSAIKL
jgi:hypothetical protein